MKFKLKKSLSEIRSEGFLILKALGTLFLSPDFKSREFILPH